MYYGATKTLSGMLSLWPQWGMSFDVIEGAWYSIEGSLGCWKLYSEGGKVDGGKMCGKLQDLVEWAEVLVGGC